MSELYSVNGKSEYDQLLSDPNTGDVIAIPCKPGSGTIKRGTVMFRGEKGLWEPATTAEVTVEKQLVVLNETVDTGCAPGGGETATAAEAAAYRSGSFIAGRVTLKEDAELSEENKVVLRLQGIVFDQKESTKTFDNKESGE